MRLVVAGVRALAVLVGFLWLAVSAASILGLLPYSNETPAVGDRILRAVPLVFVGGLLVLPYRWVRSAPWRRAVTVGLVLVVGWILYLAAGGVRGYLAGRKSWHVVPASAVFVTLGIGNLWAFHRITGERPGR